MTACARSSSAKSIAASAACCDAVAPYTRFVRAEHEKLSTLSHEIDEISGALARLRIEVERS